VKTAPLTAKSHVFRARKTVSIPCESAILAGLIRPGMSALDVGCGATGRSALLLHSLGLEVYACDVNTESVQELRGRLDDRHDIRLLAADAQALPFRPDAFDLVVVAMSGLDYLSPARSRIAALAEMERLLRPGGHLVFSSLNTVGVLLSPRGLSSRRYWRWRLRYLLKGVFARERLLDIDGIDMAHALPASVIAQVTRNTGLEFLYATNYTALTKNLLLLTCFSASPYYVFAKSPSRTQAP
jgi:ubiquinone/menaquinone biosynthesis C-methylase UbiE